MQGFVKIGLSSFCLLMLTSFASYAEEAKRFRVDCLQANTRFEKIICSTPKLEELDKQVEQHYEDKFSDLDDDEQPILENEQAGFIKVLHQCVTSQAEISLSPTSAEEMGCLLDTYRTRVAQLKSWPEDEPQLISASSQNGGLKIELTYNRLDNTYQAETQLLNKRVSEVNETSFNGCINKPSNYIINLATFLQKNKALTLTSIANGFVIHSMTQCDNSPRWQMNVITPLCVAHATATDQRGNAISIGGAPDRIYFSYIINNQIYPSFLQIDTEGKISYNLPDELKALSPSPLPEIDCQ